MVVQDFHEMKTLESYLSSENSAYKSLRNDRVKFAGGIIDGMAYLASQEVSKSDF